jgi:hypothetical protein
MNMKRRSMVGAMRPALLLVPLSLASLAVLAQAAPRPPSIENAVLGWELTQARVVSAGTTTAVPQGVITAGYVVEANATATDEATPVQSGRFRIELTAFSPRQDMPGQKAGQWYVRGDWRISQPAASEAEEVARHRPSLVNGSLSAELPFNPAAGVGPVDAAVNLRRSPQGGRWTAGTGTFSGNQRFEGLLQLGAQIWPDVGSAR